VKLSKADLYSLITAMRKGRVYPTTHEAAGRLERKLQRAGYQTGETA
jgi:hypothetical protein